VGIFCRRERSAAQLLFYSYFCASNALAGEVTELAGSEGYDTVTGSVDGVVGAQESAFTSTLRQADLTYDYLAGRNFLATKKLNAKALTFTVAGIFGCTTSFDV
jgi:hypothetical protein